jgi:hypothetical protein
MINIRIALKKANTTTLMALLEKITSTDIIMMLMTALVLMTWT